MAVGEHERRGEVAREVAVGRREIARQRETGQRREREIRRASEPGLEHPAAPRGDTVIAAHVVDARRFEVAADAAGLDAHDRARAELDRLARDARRGDRLVEADRRLDQPRQPGVADEVVVGERLLDEQQVERVERAEVGGVGERVRAVRVDLEGDVTEAVPERGDRLDVPTRLGS